MVMSSALRPRLLAFCTALLCGMLTQSAIAQVPEVAFPDAEAQYQLILACVADHDTTGIQGLCGFKTYRMYAQTAGPDEKVSAAFGYDGIPLELTSSTSFFNSTIGGATPNNIFPTLFDTPGFEDTQYDSWVTIGIDRAPTFLGYEYGNITTIGDWVNSFEPGGGMPGGNVLVNDVVGASWFTFPNLANTDPDEDQRVLLGQFTTDGIVSGSLGVQILPQTPPTDPQVPDIRLRFDFTTEFLDTPYIPNLEEGAICGCTNAESLNYDPEATVDNGTCLEPGCTYPEACNYDAGADFDDGSCSYPEFGLDCDGQCVVDTDGDGICEVIDMCIGTEDECGVCNGPGAIYECGCSAWPEGACDCEGNMLDAVGVCGGGCTADLDGDGVCDVDEIPGCTTPEACNYNPEATDDDGTCDLTSCLGCTDPIACNYVPEATVSDSSCAVPGPCDICENGMPVTVADQDGDGVCDGDEVPGCTLQEATNFDPLATDDDGSCMVLGCTDEAAQNFNPAVTEENGTCEYPCTGIAGCTYPDATNFDPLAACEDGSCTLDCPSASGSCVLDYDGNGLIGANDLVYFLSWYELPCEP